MITVLCLKRMSLPQKLFSPPGKVSWRAELLFILPSELQLPLINQYAGAIAQSRQLSQARTNWGIKRNSSSVCVHSMCVMPTHTAGMLRLMGIFASVLDAL